MLEVVAVVLALSSCSARNIGSLPDDDASPRGEPGVVAVAGTDLVVLEGARVVLAGGGSLGLVGEPSLSWVQLDGPPVALSNPSSSSPVFVAPLAPAQLVFALTAAVADRADTDTVVVDVVDDAAAIGALPPVMSLPADAVVAPGAQVVIDEPWSASSSALVDVRCNHTPLSVPGVSGGRLRIAFVVEALPCAVVVDDAAPARGIGRSVHTVWPAGTSLPPGTSVTAPAIVDPGQTVSVEFDADTRLFVGDGTPLLLTSSSTGASFVAPLRAGRVTLMAEARRGGASGGTRAVAVEVRAGAGNRAPVVDGGADLRVRPGARFQIATAVDDDDNDDVVVAVQQVLGETAVRDRTIGVLLAPSLPQTLLFHVVANDGIVDSVPDTVRVVVDPTVDNVPPALTLSPTRYVVPGATFTVDGRGARDDTGIIVSTRILQDGGDAQQLVPIDDNDPTADTFVAGAAGERYRFVVSVVDDGGLETSAPTEIIVEEAGPFVDPRRGLADGVGTAARPFLNIAQAIATAARHGFSALHLAAGESLEQAALPARVGLVGGFVFDAATTTYRAGGAATQIVAGSAVEVADAALEHVAFVDDGSGNGSLSVVRRVTLKDVAMTVQLHATPGSRVTAQDSTLASMVLTAAACDLERSDIRGSIVSTSTQLKVRGGSVDAGAAVGIDVVGGFLDIADTSIASTVSGIRLGAGSVASLAGTVEVTSGVDADVDVEVDGTVVGVDVDGGTVRFDGLTIRAHDAAQATGVMVRSGGVSGELAVLIVDVDTGVAIDSASAPLGGRVSGRVEVTAATRAVGLQVLDGAASRLFVDVEGPAAQGIVGQRFVGEAVVVVVRGGAEAAVALETGTLRHVTVVADALAVSSSGRVALRNVALRAPVGIVGDVDIGRVGLAADSVVGCAGCTLAPPATVDAETGALATDAALGGPNLFVDAGDPAEAITVDASGVPIPQGAAPDLGALERR
jgi:hypothetical protein